MPRRHSHASHHRKGTRTRKRHQPKSPMRRSRKRKLNKYFKLMLKAKESGAKEFKYKGATYVRKISKSPKSGVELVVYKKKRSSRK